MRPSGGLDRELIGNASLTHVARFAQLVSETIIFCGIGIFDLDHFVVLLFVRFFGCIVSVRVNR